MFEYIKEQVQTVTENDPSISNPLEPLFAPLLKLYSIINCLIISTSITFTLGKVYK